MNNIKIPLIELKNISLIKNERKILKNISLNIFENEIVSIIGSNGAGKTSLLDIILGLQKATNGTIRINTKKIGYVPQKFVFDLSYPLTVKEFFWLYGGKFEENGKFKDIVKKLSISNILRQNMGTLSGGELQKVLILLAIMKEPDILFLDEATAGIDSIGEKDFYKFLERIHQTKNISIVLISHDIHRVFSYSDKVICLNQTICCEGKPEHVKNNPDFTKIFGEFSSPYIHKKHKGI